MIFIIIGCIIMGMGMPDGRGVHHRRGALRPGAAQAGNSGAGVAHVRDVLLRPLHDHPARGAGLLRRGGSGQGQRHADGMDRVPHELRPVPDPLRLRLRRRPPVGRPALVDPARLRLADRRYRGLGRHAGGVPWAGRFPGSSGVFSVWHPSPSSLPPRGRSGGGRERQWPSGWGVGAAPSAGRRSPVRFGRAERFASRGHGGSGMPAAAPQQLLYYIPLSAIPGRRPADGTEPYLRPEVGFNPNWFHVRCGIDFSERWHEDPDYRWETLKVMTAEVRQRFPRPPDRRGRRATAPSRPPDRDIRGRGDGQAARALDPLLPQCLAG